MSFHELQDFFKSPGLYAFSSILSVEKFGKQEKKQIKKTVAASI